MTILATNPQKQQIHRLKRDNGWDEDTYRNLIHQFSGGRTTSSKDLTKKEAAAFIRKFLKNDSEYKAMKAECLALVRAIYAVSLEISFLNKGFTSDSPEEVEMNKAKINSFVLHHGIVKKPIAKQTYDELKQTLKQFKGISEKEP